MIFSEGQLFLHPAVQQKSLLFCLSNLLLFDVLHLLFIRQYMVMIGCTQKQCMRVFFFFFSAVAVKICAFQASFTVGEIFMRWTKISELSSWKVWRLLQLSSSEWVWIVPHVLSVCFRRIKERLKIDRLRDTRRPSYATNEANKLKICMIMHV